MHVEQVHFEHTTSICSLHLCDNPLEKGLRYLGDTHIVHIYNHSGILYLRWDHALVDNKVQEVIDQGHDHF